MEKEIHKDAIGKTVARITRPTKNQVIIEFTDGESILFYTDGQSIDTCEGDKPKPSNDAKAAARVKALEALEAHCPHWANNVYPLPEDHPYNVKLNRLYRELQTCLRS